MRKLLLKNTSWELIPEENSSEILIFKIKLLGFIKITYVYKLTG